MKKASTVLFAVAAGLATLAAVVVAFCLAWLRASEGFEGLIPAIIVTTVPGMLLIIAVVLAIIASIKRKRETRGVALLGVSSTRRLQRLSSNKYLAIMYLVCIIGLMLELALPPVDILSTSSDADFLLWLVYTPIASLTGLIVGVITLIVSIIGLVIEQPLKAKIVPALLFVTWVVIYLAEFM